MKKIGIILIASILLSLPGLAQKGQGGGQQQKVNKITFLSNKLKLTPDEAEKFWPVYHEMEAKFKAQKKAAKAAKPDKKVGEMTDAEVEKLIDGAIDQQQKELDLKKEYHTKFKAVLPVKKVAKLYHAEIQFKKMRAKQKAAKKAGNGGGNNGGGGHGGHGGNRPAGSK